MKQKHTVECDENCSCGKYVWVYDEQIHSSKAVLGEISLLLVRHKAEDNKKTWSVEIQIPYERLVLALQNYY